MSQMTDSRGFRTGAAISVLLLGVAALLHVNEPTGSASALLVAAIAAAMLLSAATGLRVSLLGLPFRILRERGVIGAPAPKDLQPVPGLRLAQVMGGTMLLLGVLADTAFAADLTGICVACKLYGVVVWFQNRSLPHGATKIAPQKIRMTKGSGR